MPAQLQADLHTMPVTQEEPRYCSSTSSYEEDYSSYQYSVFSDDGRPPAPEGLNVIRLLRKSYFASLPPSQCKGTSGGPNEDDDNDYFDLFEEPEDLCADQTSSSRPSSRVSPSRDISQISPGPISDPVPSLPKTRRYAGVSSSQSRDSADVLEEQPGSAGNEYARRRKHSDRAQEEEWCSVPWNPVGEGPIQEPTACKYDTFLRWPEWVPTQPWDVMACLPQAMVLASPRESRMVAPGEAEDSLDLFKGSACHEKSLEETAAYGDHGWISRHVRAKTQPPDILSCLPEATGPSPADRDQLVHLEDGGRSGCPCDADRHNDKACEESVARHGGFGIPFRERAETQASSMLIDLPDARLSYASEPEGSTDRENVLGGCRFPISSGLSAMIEEYPLIGGDNNALLASPGREYNNRDHAQPVDSAKSAMLMKLIREMGARSDTGRTDSIPLSAARVTCGGGHSQWHLDDWCSCALSDEVSGPSGPLDNWNGGISLSQPGSPYETDCVQHYFSYWTPSSFMGQAPWLGEDLPACGDNASSPAPPESRLDKKDDCNLLVDDWRPASLLDLLRDMRGTPQAIGSENAPRGVSDSRSNWDGYNQCANHCVPSMPGNMALEDEERAQGIRDDGTANLVPDATCRDGEGEGELVGGCKSSLLLDLICAIEGTHEDGWCDAANLAPQAAACVDHGYEPQQPTVGARAMNDVVQCWYGVPREDEEDLERGDSGYSSHGIFSPAAQETLKAFFQSRPHGP